MNSKGIPSKIRELCMLLIKNVSREDIEFIEILLGKSIRDLLDEDTVLCFLMLLEQYMKYVHDMAMLYSIDEIFENLGKGAVD